MARCDGDGLVYEAYKPGDNFDWNSLEAVGDTVFDEAWNPNRDGWDPAVQPTPVQGSIWYEDLHRMASEIPNLGHGFGDQSFGV